MSLCVEDRLVCRFGLIQTCIPDGHLHRVTYTRCRINTTNSPDDGHMAVRNMYGIEINVYRKELCVKLIIYNDYNEIHGQQNIYHKSMTQSPPLYGTVMSSYLRFILCTRHFGTWFYSLM